MLGEKQEITENTMRLRKRKVYGSFLPIQCSMPEKNLQAYLDIEAARQSRDASSLTGEAKSIQDKLDSYYSGSDEGFAFMGMGENLRTCAQFLFFH